MVRLDRMGLDLMRYDWMGCDKIRLVPMRLDMFRFDMQGGNLYLLFLKYGEKMNRNKLKNEFKKIFLDKISNFNYGDFIKNEDVLHIAHSNNIDLSIDTLKAWVRELELLIGLEHKKRLKRIKNEGWLVLEPITQVVEAVREGRKRVKTALNKTSQRLKAVEVGMLTNEQQNELLKRTSAVDSLLNIISNTSLVKPIVRREELEQLKLCENKIVEIR